MPELILAGEYTDVRKAAFGKDAYRFVAPPPPKVVSRPKEQLRSEHDKEELARIREMSDAQLSQHRMPDQDNFKDKVRQMGHPMHSNTLVRMVLKANPKLVVEDSVNCKGHAAFYYFEVDGAKKPTNAHFKKGILPEFSIMETDAADLPVRVQYGWREVLSRLVKAKQLRLGQVLRMFGDTTTVQSSHWRRQLQPFRG